MNTPDIELPAEFRSGNDIPVTQATIKRERMEEILRDAIEADRQRRVEPTAAEISDVIREITGCPDIKNGGASLVVALGMLFHRCAAPQPAEPDEERLAMEAVMESVDPATWPGLTVAQRCALSRFAKPQPAEPVKRKRRYAQGTALGEYGVIPMCDQVDDEPVKVPSDEGLLQLASEYCDSTDATLAAKEVS